EVAASWVGKVEGAGVGVEASRHASDRVAGRLGEVVGARDVRGDVGQQRGAVGAPGRHPVLGTNADGTRPVEGENRLSREDPSERATTPQPWVISSGEEGADMPIGGNT